MGKRYIKTVITELKKMREYQVTKEGLSKIDWLITNLEMGIGDYEDLLVEAKRIGLRNPAFEGDMIGWLDDDFDWDELDEERKKRKKK